MANAVAAKVVTIVTGRRGSRELARHLVARRAFTLIEVLAALTIVSILFSLGYPRLDEAKEQAKIAQAIGDLHAMAIELNTKDPLPETLAGTDRADRLDPWGRPYVYYKFPPTTGNAGPKGARKDRFLHPLNSYYDLYSVGKDGGSSAPLTAKASQDDVIIANDGGFVGLAKKY
jgi:general secretion pathway protein G